MKEINIENWNRKAHFKQFNSYIQPCFEVDVRLDMTAFRGYIKEKNLNFFASFLYIVMRAANGCAAFRRRITGGKVVEYERVNPSYTVFLEDCNFAFCETDYRPSYKDFAERVSLDIAKTKKRNSSDGDENLYADRNDLVYISCLPWIDVLSISNPLPLDNPESLSIPRINWGKCVEHGAGYRMTLSVTVNHALMDGYEVSQFILKIQEMIDNPGQIFMVD